jgi:hypothetical protein
MCVCPWCSCFLQVLIVSSHVYYGGDDGVVGSFICFDRFIFCCVGS